MFALFLNFIINTIIHLVQYFTASFNLLISTYLPDISNQIINITTTITSFFVNALSWPLSILPQGILNTLILILTIELARHTIHFGTYAFIRLWNLFRRLKFW